jgi:DNA-binding NtrC family response regulator
VYLPVTNQAELASDRSLPVRGAGRVLFVDDEESLARAGRLILETYGYEVDAFTSSVDAARAVKEDPGLYDIVVTDQTMPSMTGSALAKAVRETRPDIPVIICTGFSVKDSVGTDNVTNLLFKPLDSAQLTRAVHDALAVSSS